MVDYSPNDDANFALDFHLFLQDIQHLLFCLCHTDISSSCYNLDFRSITNKYTVIVPYFIWLSCLVFLLFSFLPCL